MILKKEIEALRLKTKLAECKDFLETSAYPSQKEAATLYLKSLQESYKELTGDYAKEFLLESEEASVNEEGPAAGVYGNNISYIKKGNDIFLNARDIVEYITGPGKEENMETFKGFLIGITNAGG